jgi:aspartyl-tRNA(Asn)/glutamyl-tRNA(Gln) amidotransferase subunit A
VTLWKESAEDLARKVRGGDVSASEVLESILMRIAEVEQHVNAFLSIDADGAKAGARDIDERVAQGEDPGPLAGVPVAVKDNICTRDVETTCASHILEGFRPVYDATAVSNLRRRGAVILGKTNMDEFGMGSSTENSAFGPTRNPWKLDRVPGGSSGGSAATVASGMSPLALGSDTGGSVRQPAGMCGLVAMKPHYGSVSRYGLVAFASSLDQIGPMARTASDCALLYNAVLGHDPLDSTSLAETSAVELDRLSDSVAGMTMGLPRSWMGEGCDPEVQRAADETVAVLESLGVTFRDVSLPKPDHSLAAYYILADAEASSNLARYDGIRYGPRVEEPEDLEDLYTRTRGEGFGAEVKRRIILGTYVLSAGYYDAYYRKAQRARRLIRESLESALKGLDALLIPTSPTPPFRLGEKIEDPLAMYLSDIYTITANLAGYPALAFPAGVTDDGLPVGMQLYGRDGSEEKLFRLVAAHEAATEIPRLVEEITP